MESNNIPKAKTTDDSGTWPRRGEKKEEKGNQIEEKNLSIPPRRKRPDVYKGCTRIRCDHFTGRHQNETKRQHLEGTKRAVRTLKRCVPEHVVDTLLYPAQAKVSQGDQEVRNTSLQEESTSKSRKRAGSRCVRSSCPFVRLSASSGQALQSAPPVRRPSDLRLCPCSRAGAGKGLVWPGLTPTTFRTSPPLPDPAKGSLSADSPQLSRW